jgi:hypothetical protein
VVAVPSAITSDDRNFLLNPAHSGFKLIRRGTLMDCEFDPRLLGR